MNYITPQQLEKSRDLAISTLKALGVTFDTAGELNSQVRHSPPYQLLYMHIEGGGIGRTLPINGEHKSMGELICLHRRLKELFGVILPPPGPMIIGWPYQEFKYKETDYADKI